MVTVFWRGRNSGASSAFEQKPSTPADQQLSPGRIMNSPLPDSSQLEAGIIEDSRPSRLSRVQDNVRDLLRTSVFGSVRGSPSLLRSSSNWARTPEIRQTPPPSPLRTARQPEVLQSPASSISTTSSQESSCPDDRASPFQSNQPIPGVLFPPTTHQSYQQAVQHMAHQSTLFNTRAVAALNHPDISDYSLRSLDKEKAEHHHRRAAAKRSRHHHNHYRSSSSRHVAVRSNSSSIALSVLSGLLLSALVATYLALVTTSQSTVTPTFHILFVLGILLALIVFTHTVLRLCISRRSNKQTSSSKRNKTGYQPRVLILPALSGASNGAYVRRHRPAHELHDRHNVHHRNHRGRTAHYRPRRNHPQREIPTQPSHSEESFVPPTPIPVQVSSDTGARSPISPAHSLPLQNQALSVPKQDSPLPAPPPPAYGRWRGSVRADPDLLHWQAVAHSPVEPTDIPSPTYRERDDETSVHGQSAGQTAPPSYVTRDSPARQQRREHHDQDRSQAADLEAGVHINNAATPEMIEVRGGVVVGMAL